MTVAELLYGAECSNEVEENRKEVLSFCADIEIIPVGLALSEYASQKLLPQPNVHKAVINNITGRSFINQFIID